MRCHGLPHLAYCDALAVEVGQLTDVVRGADPDAPVPTCGAWTMSDLMRHTGQIHRWAASMVRDLSHTRLAQRERLFPGPSPAQLPEWIREGGEETVGALRSAEPDATMWAWGADKHARFWARRMLHETTMHRFDAELAVGICPKPEPDVAVDGVDEFLENLLCAAYFAPGVRRLRGAGEQIVLAATDVDVSWTIQLARDGFTWRHGPDGGTVRVDGSAADLYLFAWGRVRPGDPQLHITGDRALVDHWVANSAL